jgi:hypothetical protein
VHVFITNPRLLLDLQFFLQRIGCAADQVDAHDLEVEVPGAPSAAQAHRELELYLALWQGRKSISDAAVHICSRDAGASSAFEAER